MLIANRMFVFYSIKYVQVAHYATCLSRTHLVYVPPKRIQDIAMSRRRYGHVFPWKVLRISTQGTSVESILFFDVFPVFV